MKKLNYFEEDINHFELPIKSNHSYILGKSSSRGFILPDLIIKNNIKNRLLIYDYRGDYPKNFSNISYKFTQLVKQWV